MAPTRNAAVLSSKFNTTFIEQYNKQSRVTKPARKPRSAEECQSFREFADRTPVRNRPWADGTKQNVLGMQKKWKRYCEFQRLGNWTHAIATVTRAILMDFWEYLLERSKVASCGTSLNYWRHFKQLYALVRGQFLDLNLNREVKQYHDTVLVRKFSLRLSNVDDKPVVGAKDLLALLSFNIAYDKGVFALESHRIALAGCYLFLAYTGARPAEIVDNEVRDNSEDWKNTVRQSTLAHHRDEEWEKDRDAQDNDARELERLLDQEPVKLGRPKALCYEDVTLTLFRDHATGKDTLAMAIKLIHHKGADRKPRPTIFYFFPAKRAIFCLILVIIAQALSDEAFDADHLTTPERFFEVKTGPPNFSLVFRWKKSKSKLPIFRKCSASGVSDHPIPYHILRDDLERQTLDAGFEEYFGPRSFRRGTANAVNGKASDAARDQIMRHDPKFVTFYNSYINQKVQFDTQSAFLDEPPQDALIDLFTHMSITQDHRASRDIVPEVVWASICPNPTIQELVERRAALKKGSYRIKDNPNKEEIKKLSQEISLEKKKERQRVVAEYRAHYFWNKSTLDIENQLMGLETIQYVPPSMDLSISERRELAELLVNQPPDLDDGQLQPLRLQVIKLMVVLSRKQETLKDTIIRRTDVATEIKSTPISPDPFPLRMEKTQCPGCIGDDRQTYEARTFKYCRPAVLFDHFDRVHAKDMAPPKNITCSHPKCVKEGLQFTHLNQFKNHVERVHGVKLRGG